MQRGNGLLRLSRIAAALTGLLALAALIAPLPKAASAAAERTIVLDARMFAYTPGRLRVNQGDRVTLTLQSSDVVHGLYIDGYDVDIQAQPGQPAETTFVADRLGKFKFRCSVTCGAMHPFMIGELVVGPNIPFWRAVAALLIVSVGTVITLRLGGHKA